MNSIRIFEPKVTMFTTTVEIPVRDLRVDGIANGKDVYEANKIFTNMLNTYKDPNIKKDCELCCRTLKWAYTCNGSLKSIINIIGDNKAIVFVFSFNDLENLLDFTNNLKVNVG